MEYVSVDKEICCVANLIRKEFDNLVFGSVYSEERITRMNIWIIDTYMIKREKMYSRKILNAKCQLHVQPHQKL